MRHLPRDLLEGFSKPLMVTGEAT